MIRNGMKEKGMMKREGMGKYKLKKKKEKKQTNFTVFLRLVERLPHDCSERKCYFVLPVNQNHGSITKV